jgi:hypothetical protein
VSVAGAAISCILSVAEQLFQSWEELLFQLLFRGRSYCFSCCFVGEILFQLLFRGRRYCFSCCFVGGDTVSVVVSWEEKLFQLLFRGRSYCFSYCFVGGATVSFTVSWEELLLPLLFRGWSNCFRFCSIEGVITASYSVSITGAASAIVSVAGADVSTSL